MPITPEDRARDNIDKLLTEAGWIVQDKKATNLSAGRAVTDPANNLTSYAYDSEDTLSAITDANNHTTNFADNARGWVTQTTFPSTLYETYGYDAVGNLTSKTDRKNQTIQYVYDALVTGVTGDFGLSLSYAYDQLGRLTKAKPDSTTVSFQYDSNGYISAVLDNNGKVLESHTYDSAGEA